MKKIYITGGDNGYCARCNGLCDRNAMLIDTDKKTIQDISKYSFCLGKRCWRIQLVTIDGADCAIEKDIYTNKLRLIDMAGDEMNIPVIVKGNKWGKDCEFGSYGSYFAGEKLDNGDVELGEFIDNEYWNKYLKNKDTDIKKYVRKTGWKLIMKGNRDE